MSSEVLLREVTEDDLSALFGIQLDPAASHMAAFTAEDPTDWEAFKGHWTKILDDDSIIKMAIVYEGRLAGYVSQFERFDKLEVAYWIAREQWGKGLATSALSIFLDQVTARPLYARAATDNVASIRVLEKCGFSIDSQNRAFANARGEEIEELLLKMP